MPASQLAGLLACLLTACLSDGVTAPYRREARMAMSGARKLLKLVQNRVAERDELRRWATHASIGTAAALQRSTTQLRDASAAASMQLAARWSGRTSACRRTR
jgi:hypothetical protein